jgi:hypothetical protein
MSMCGCVVAFTGVRLFQSGVVKPSPKWYQPDVENVMNLALEVKQTLNKMSPVTNTQQLAATVFSSGETLTLLKVWYTYISASQMF